MFRVRPGRQSERSARDALRAARFGAPPNASTAQVDPHPSRAPNDPKQWKKDDLVVELRMAELKATSAGRAQRSTPAPSMRVALSDLVSLKASDVGMTDLAVGPSRSNADGFTDGGITRGEHRERELVAWTPAAGEEALGVEGAGGLLEDPAMKAKGGGRGGWGGRGGGGGGAQWDQFAANKSMFGVDTSFDETMYTTSIDKSAGGISEAEAARIAREIQSSVSSNAHMQEERGQRVTADYDEEDLYGAVVGTGAAAGGAHAGGKGGVQRGQDVQASRPWRASVPILRAGLLRLHARVGRGCRVCPGRAEAFGLLRRHVDMVRVRQRA